MSERFQGTAARLHERMLQRYGDEMHHKHDKSHVTYRQHYRTHGVVKSVKAINNEPYDSTGTVREINLRKFRRGLVKGRIH